MGDLILERQACSQCEAGRIGKSRNELNGTVEWRESDGRAALERVPTLPTSTVVGFCGGFFLPIIIIIF